MKRIWGKRIPWAGLVLAAVLGAAAAAEQDVAGIVMERQQLMKRQGAAMTTIAGFARGGAGTIEDVAGAARTLRETAARIAPLFPEGSGPADVDRPETGAKPIIWERWDDFVAESEALEAAAATVEAAALAGDAEAVTAAFSSLGNKGCGGCHQTFRRKLR